MRIRDFDALAAEWDEQPGRVKLAGELAEAFCRAVAFGPTWTVLDFGCGTGLVSLRLAGSVGEIIGVDASAGMLARLAAKAGQLDLENVRTSGVSGTSGALADTPCDAVISSMTLHHIDDVPALLRRFHDTLRPGGFLALADLDTEDGSFHADPTGICHHGFDRDALARQCRAAGFTDVTCTTATVIERVAPDGAARSYPVFMLVARRA